MVCLLVPVIYNGGRMQNLEFKSLDIGYQYTGEMVYKEYSYCEYFNVTEVTDENEYLTVRVYCINMNSIRYIDTDMVQSVTCMTILGTTRVQSINPVTKYRSRKCVTMLTIRDTALHYDSIPYRGKPMKEANAADFYKYIRRLVMMDTFGGNMFYRFDPSTIGEVHFLFGVDMLNRVEQCFKKHSERLGRDCFSKLRTLVVTNSSQLSLFLKYFDVERYTLHTASRNMNKEQYLEHLPIDIDRSRIRELIMYDVMIPHNLLEPEIEIEVEECTETVTVKPINIVDTDSVERTRRDYLLKISCGNKSIPPALKKMYVQVSFTDKLRGKSAS